MVWVWMGGSDTPTGCVDAFDYDVATGAVSGRRTVIRIAAENGFPDGYVEGWEVWKDGIWVQVKVHVDDVCWPACFFTGLVVCLFMCRPASVLCRPCVGPRPPVQVHD